MTSDKVICAEKATNLIKEAWEAVAQMYAVDLDKVNRVRPDDLRYSSRGELIREYVSRANAVATFAVNVGLITPAEATELQLEFERTHPEIPKD